MPSNPLLFKEAHTIDTGDGVMLACPASIDITLRDLYIAVAWHACVFDPQLRPNVTTEEIITATRTGANQMLAAREVDGDGE